MGGIAAAVWREPGMHVTWARVPSPRADHKRPPEQAKAALRAARWQARNLGAPFVRRVLRCVSSIRGPMRARGPLRARARPGVMAGLPASFGLTPADGGRAAVRHRPVAVVHGHGGLGGGAGGGGCQPAAAVLSAAGCPAGAGGR